MAFLESIDQIRGFGDWASSYLWDIAIPDSPFPDWFPASSVDDPIAAISSYQFELHQDTYSVPQKRQLRELSITFYDSADHKLYDWLKEWVDELIFNKGKGLTPLASCVKKCRIARLNPDKSINKLTIYDIYPDGSITDPMDSESNLKQFTVGFVIAGETKG